MGPEVVLPWLAEQGGVAATALFWLIILGVIGRTRISKAFVTKMIVEPVISFLLKELTRTNSGGYLMDHINAHFDGLHERLGSGSHVMGDHEKRLSVVEERTGVTR